MRRADLEPLIIEGLSRLGGSAHYTLVAKYIWDNFEAQLRTSGPMFYKWQYEMRWAGRDLRIKKRIAQADPKSPGIWTLS